MRRSDTRAGLLRAATEMFAKHGFQGARVDGIASRARANKALIYYHFKTKAGLFDAVLTALLSEARAELEAIAASEPDPGRRVLRLYDGLAALFERRPALPRIVLRELLDGGGQIGAGPTRVLGGALDVVMGTIEEGVAAGTFRRVNPLFVHVNAMGTLLVDAVGRAFRERLRRDLSRGSASADTPEALRAYLHDVLTRTLAPDRGPHQEG